MLTFAKDYGSSRGSDFVVEKKFFFALISSQRSSNSRAALCRPGKSRRA
jgi:hypothetical protein